jgi:RimJ/RimL family protein N-acetyltransferase
MFEPLVTKRLTIRPFAEGDLDGYHALRNDPEVARYQDWVTPYPRSESERVVSKVIAMEGPENEEWWMAIVADRITGETYGDLALHLGDEERTAEVGYSFGSAHWGRGYATEALEALVRYLFEDRGVTRVFGMLHPDNPASAMVLERAGFLYEGHLKSSFWLEGECSDDLIYGLTRPDWEVWHNRPRNRPETVTLRELTAEGLESVLALRTHRSQVAYVPPVARSIADAMYPDVVNGAPLESEMFTVHADDDLVGFVILTKVTDAHPDPILWRLLIDRMHQRRGIGAMVLDAVLERSRSTSAERLVTNWCEGKGSPGPFYLSSGFVPTGVRSGRKVQAVRTL